MLPDVMLDNIPKDPYYLRLASWDIGEFDYDHCDQISDIAFFLNYCSQYDSYVELC